MDNIYSKLEFNKVLKIVSKYCQTNLAKDTILNVKYKTDIEEINELLNETEEALLILTRYDSVPLGGVTDIYSIIKRASLGSSLNSLDLLKVLGVLYAVKQNKSFIGQLDKYEIESKFINEYIENLITLPQLDQAISRSIDEAGNVLDSASQTLFNIRKNIKVIENRIRERVRNIANSKKNMLTSNIITIRNNRLVLGVKVEFKNAFEGIIHDYSGSGETVYMEPASVVESNNKLNTLHIEETNEIDRILYELTQLVGSYDDELRNNLDILIKLDIIFAKARYARDNNCSRVILNEDGYVKLLEAKHPLINKDDVIANNIILGKDYKGIVITGPNTGGKTVVLKTCGVIALMVQSGFLVPVKEGSTLNVFDKIFADIGDEQSIEQSLSTFSSHMKNIINIVDNVTHNSLVLVDELGSGTDPKEGASLAKSILDYIMKVGALIIATTHYTDLKAYAYMNEDLINASVEFDTDTLRPTYRLLIGIPGRSNAFLISEKLGLRESIINYAKDSVETSNSEVSDLINKLEKQGLAFDNLIKETELEKKKYEELYNEVSKKSYDLDTKYNMEINKAKEEAYLLLKNAQTEAKQIIDELRNSRNEKDHVLIEKQTKLKDLVSEYTKVELKKDTSNKPLKVNDQVMVLEYNRSGIITKVISKTKYEVQMGTLVGTYNRNQLTKVVKDKNEKKITKKKVSIKKTTTVTMELDLRGFRYEDALVELDNYIDRAMLSNMPKIYIIHGHGTGVLREAVQNYLKSNPFIKEYRYGVAGEGGNGVTVATLK